VPSTNNGASVLCIGASNSAHLLERALHGYAVTMGDDADAMVTVAQRCCYDAYVASDEVCRDRLAALWQAVRGFDRNTPFLILLSRPLAPHDMLLRYGYDGTVDVADGAMGVRQALEQLLEAALDRALEARAVEAAVLHDAVVEQIGSRTLRMALAGKAMKRADEHTLRAQAMAVFEARGGPPSCFSRLWADMFAELVDDSRTQAQRNNIDS
jgi:hypothetical protein